MSPEQTPFKYSSLESQGHGKYEKYYKCQIVLFDVCCMNSAEALESRPGANLGPTWPGIGHGLAMISLGSARGQSDCTSSCHTRKALFDSFFSDNLCLIIMSDPVNACNLSVCCGYILDLIN